MTKPPEWRPPADQLPGQYSDYHIHHKRRGDPARKGGFGVVYRASRADVPGMSYALKFLTREGLPYEAILEEARTAIGLSHEYVAKTIDVLDLRPYQGDGWCPAALVMLFYPASLKDVIELLRNDKEKLPRGIGCEYLFHVVSALDCLHVRERRTHRDVKPSNVLVKLPPDRESRANYVT